jgi:PAS domain S-box-containing protein
MSESHLPTWIESRIEQALLWLQRIALGLLLVAALVRQELVEALVIAVALAAHTGVYLATARMEFDRSRRQAITVVDFVVAVSVFYLTGDVDGQTGLLGFCVAGLVAARWSLWQALGINAAIWVLFSLPPIHSWLWQNGPAPTASLANLAIFLALTFIFDYLVSMEESQSRFAHTTSLRTQQLSALQRTTQELTSTLSLDSVLQVVLESAVQTTGASQGNIMLTDMQTGDFTLGAAEGYSEEEEAAIEATLLDLDRNSLTWQVLESGQARVVRDARLESHPVCEKADALSAMAVPILYEKGIVGVIHLRHTQVARFGDDELGFVQTLAEQASVAIGNAMRFEEQVRVNVALRRRTEQMGSLLAIGRKLGADVPLEETLEEVSYAIQETVGFNIVLISVVEDPESSVPMLRRLAAAGLPVDVFEDAKKIRHPLEQYEHLLREKYRQGTCYFYPFQEQADWGSGLHTLAAMPDADDWTEGQWHQHDMLLVPLRGSGGRLLGHISVDDPRDGRRPTRQTLETLTIFADQAAIAVENARLYADAQHRADNLVRMNRASQALAQPREPALVLKTLVQAVTDLLQCEAGAIFQPDPFDGKYCPTASAGVDLLDMDTFRSAPGEGLVGHVAATSNGLLIPDTEDEPRFVGGPKPIGSMLLAPIMAGKQAIGVLTAAASDKEAFSEADQVLLTTLADQAAVALEGARLLADTQQAAVRLSLLNEIGRRAAGKLELQEMLETTVNSLHRNLGFFRVAVFLQGANGEKLWVAAANESFWHVIPPDHVQEVGSGLVGLAAAMGETVLANDTAADERHIRVGDWDAPAGLSAPIRVGEQVIGVLHAEADQPRSFAEGDVAALEIAADQLAVAIQNARLFQETERRMAELATINEIGRAISSALDATQLAELIYNQVSKLLDTRNFHVALRDRATGLTRVEFLVEHGVRQQPMTLKPGQGLTSHLVRTGEPILLNHGSEDFLQAHGLSQTGVPAKSWLGVPMIAEDQVIGAIAVQSFGEEDAFDLDHLNLLTTIAGQAAVAYQNASLFQERDRRIDQLAVLNEMAQAMSSTLELDELLETAQHQVSQLIDTAHFYIALHEEGSDEWTMALQLKDGEPQPSRRFKVLSGLTGHIIRTRAPILLHDLEENVAFHNEHGIEYGGRRAKSWMGVPMLAKDKVLGVIAVQSHSHEHAYTQENLNLLSTVAAQAAVAVRNAQLYQQIVHFSSDLESRVEARTQDLEEAMKELTTERDRAETLYRITSELGASLELERVLERALLLFSDALGIEHGTITLVDQETGQLELRASLEGIRGAHMRGERTPLMQATGLAGWVLQNREPALVEDVTEDPRWLEVPEKELEIRSVVAAPLSLGGGDVLGVLTLGHPEAGHFGQEHVQLVTAAGAQVAIAVNNSDLYSFITQQADRVGSMLQSQRAESAKSRAILESIADGVLVLDHNGRVLLVNPAAEDLLGFSAMAIQGEHFRHILGLGETLVHRELAQGLYTELRQRQEAPGQSEEAALPATIRLASGNQVLAVNIAPLITEVGGVPGLVAALRDISREAEVERLKNEFISTVSHELRTPMTSIKGYTDLLFVGMAGGLSDAQRNFLQIIKSNADRLTALVNDILDISRIETGRLRLSIEQLNLGEIVSQVVTAFREQYRESNLALKWAEPEELPQVRGDAARVTQVLNNLLGNAWHYTPSGGHVEVSIHEEDGFLRVDVADNGIGIDEDDLARIFDRFYRVDHPVVQEVGGTGLGLSIVKMFVELLGGEIRVESELNVGSVFSFTVPLITTELPEETFEPPEMLTTDSPSAVKRRAKILVVEDDRDLALLLRRQLESDGYQVLLAGSGEDALWLAKEEQPQLITLDLVLPDIDGFTVLERLKEHPVTAPIPVIIVSVSPEGDRGYALGAVDYVVKPFEEEKLLHSVSQALATLEEGVAGKVLVVDDDLDILNFLDEALSYYGYDVSTAAGGREALEKVAKDLPDLILLDIKMPGMNGYEVIRRLKSSRETSPIPVIVITASPVDQERDKVQVLGMGATHYMTKPLSIEALIREVKVAIEERQQA